VIESDVHLGVDIGWGGDGVTGQDGLQLVATTVVSGMALSSMSWGKGGCCRSGETMKGMMRGDGSEVVYDHSVTG